MSFNKIIRIAKHPLMADQPGARSIGTYELPDDFVKRPRGGLDDFVQSHSRPRGGLDDFVNLHYLTSINTIQKRNEFHTGGEMSFIGENGSPFVLVNRWVSERCSFSRDVAGAGKSVSTLFSQSPKRTGSQTSVAVATSVFSYQDGFIRNIVRLGVRDVSSC